MLKMRLNYDLYLSEGLGYSTYGGDDLWLHPKQWAQVKRIQDSDLIKALLC